MLQANFVVYLRHWRVATILEFGTCVKTEYDSSNTSEDDDGDEKIIRPRITGAEIL